MCVYSQDAEHTRKAKRGEPLITHDFGHATGFASPGDKASSKTAICMLPGAEIAFDRPPRYKGMVRKLAGRAIPDKVATLVHVNGENNHDALRFPSLEEPVLLNDLAVGQDAKVLKLSAQDEPPQGERPSVAQQMAAHGVVETV